MIAVAEKKYTIRIPDELHAQMVELAERDRRSLHAEMLILMEEAVQARRQRAQPWNASAEQRRERADASARDAMLRRMETGRKPLQPPDDEDEEQP